MPLFTQGSKWVPARVEVDIVFEKAFVLVIICNMCTSTVKDYCLDNTPCQNNATCRNLFSVGADYECQCPNGYFGLDCEIGKLNALETICVCVPITIRPACDYLVDFVCPVICKENVRKMFKKQKYMVLI